VSDTRVAGQDDPQHPGAFWLHAVGRRVWSTTVQACDVPVRGFRRKGPYAWAEKEREGTKGNTWGPCDQLVATRRCQLADFGILGLFFCIIAGTTTMRSTHLMPPTDPTPCQLQQPRATLHWCSLQQPMTSR
jgi:hypothetical protein